MGQAPRQHQLDVKSLAVKKPDFYIECNWSLAKATLKCNGHWYSRRCQELFNFVVTQEYSLHMMLREQHGEALSDGPELLEQGGGAAEVKGDAGEEEGAEKAQDEAAEVKVVVVSKAAGSEAEVKPPPPEEAE
jgi:hypothetical protein